MIVGVVGVTLMSDNSLLNHIASCVAVLSVIYFASVAESATTDCFLLSQLIAPPDMTNRFSVVESQLSMSPAHSASENPIRLLSSDLSYFNPRLVVPLR